MTNTLVVLKSKDAVYEYLNSSWYFDTGLVKFSNSTVIKNDEVEYVVSIDSDMERLRGIEFKYVKMDSVSLSMKYLSELLPQVR